MTHKLPLQPSPEESAQMRADRLTLPIEHPGPYAWLDSPFKRIRFAGSENPGSMFGPRIEFTGEKGK